MATKSVLKRWLEFLLQVLKTIFHPISVPLIFEPKKGYFYWTDERQHRNTVSSINYPSRQPTKKSTEFEMNNNVGISFHRVLSSSNQPTDQVTSYNQACEEKKCSHLCLRRSSYTGPDVTCACPAGIDFKIDSTGTKSKTECNLTPQAGFQINAILLASQSESLFESL